VTIKLLQAFRAFLLNLVSFVGLVKYSKFKESQTAFVYTNTLIINKLFMVNGLRSVLAIVWLLAVFCVGLLMRPMWANLFLFGRYNGTESKIEVKLGNKPIILERVDFKRIQSLPPPGEDYLDPKPSLLTSTYKYAYEKGESTKDEGSGPRLWRVKHDERLATGIDTKRRPSHSTSRKKSFFAGLISTSTRALGGAKVEKVPESEPFLAKEDEEESGEEKITKYVPPTISSSSTSDQASLVGLESRKSKSSPKSSASQSKEEE